MESHAGSYEGSRKLTIMGQMDFQIVIRKASRNVNKLATIYGYNISGWHLGGEMWLTFIGHCGWALLVFGAAW